MERLLTTEEVAEWLRLDVVTVRRLIARGVLAAYRVAGEYRLKRGDVEAYLEGQRVTEGNTGAIEPLDQVHAPGAPGARACL